MALNWNACGNVLESFNCMNDLGFSAPSDKSNEFYRPGDFPKNGTETLYNTGGSLTVPPSGKVFTWHQSTATFTVTAASYNGKNVQAAGTTVAGVAATGTVDATGSGNTGASSPGSAGAVTTGSSAALEFKLFTMWTFVLPSLVLLLSVL